MSVSMSCQSSSKTNILKVQHTVTEAFSLHRVVNLTIISSNIAIPTSLTSENEEGQLQLVFYIQLEGGFLSKEQLEMAVQVL